MFDQLVSGIPAGLRLAVIGELITLAAIIGVGAHAYKKRRKLALFIAIAAIIPSAIFWATPFALPYLNANFSFQTVDVPMADFNMQAGQLAFWQHPPDYFRYYMPVDFLELETGEAANRFFASDTPVYCLMKTDDFKAMQPLINRPIYDVAHYVVKRRAYTLASQFQRNE